MKSVRMNMWELSRDIATRKICYIEVKRSLMSAVRERFYFSEILVAPSFPECITAKSGDSYVSLTGVKSITLHEGYYRIECKIADDTEVARIVFDPALAEEEELLFMATGKAS